MNLNFVKPHFTYSVATCRKWLLYWTAQKENISSIIDRSIAQCHLSRLLDVHDEGNGNTVLLEFSLQKNDPKISRKILVKRVPRKKKKCLSPLPEILNFLS